jgi:hypothetical protein
MGALWTVVGLVVDDGHHDLCAGDLLIAGVYEGDLTSSDAEQRTGGFRRWAATVEASTADEAEAVALVQHGQPELERVRVVDLVAGDVVVDRDDPESPTVRVVAAVEVGAAGVRARFDDGTTVAFDVARSVPVLYNPHHAQRVRA